MRTLGQLLTLLKADGHPDARAIKIYSREGASAAVPGSAFIAVNRGESEPVPITEDEKALLLDHGATHDDREIYASP